MRERLASFGRRLSALVNTPWFQGVFLLALMAASAKVLWYLVDNQVTGYSHDDGVYAITAKALAEGKGYRLLFLPGEPPMGKYPILYPLLLSIGWRIEPKFPDVLPWLNALTVGCWVLFIPVAYGFLRHIFRLSVWQTGLILCLLATNYYLNYNASQLMSESLFMLTSFSTLWMAEAWLGQQRLAALPPGERLRVPLWRQVVLGVMTILSFQSRTLGLLLAPPIAIRLFRQASWKASLLYSAIVGGLGVLPWMLWVRWGEAQLGPERHTPLVRAFVNYSEEFMHNAAWRDWSTTLSNTLSSLLTATPEHFICSYAKYLPIYWLGKDRPLLTDLHAVTVVAFPYLLLGYFVLRGLQAVRRKQWTLSGGYLFLYLLVIVLWQYEDQMQRFLIVIVPLMWVYLLQPLFRWHPPSLGRKAIRAACFALIWLGSSTSFPVMVDVMHDTRQSHAFSYKPNGYWEDYAATFRFINQHIPDHVNVAADREVLTYLFTNNHAMYFSGPSVPWETVSGKKDKTHAYRLLMDNMRKHRIQVVLLEPSIQGYDTKMVVNPLFLVMRALYPNSFRQLYVSPNGYISVYRLFPPGQEPPKDQGYAGPTSMEQAQQDLDAHQKKMRGILKRPMNQPVGAPQPKR